MRVNHFFTGFGFTDNTSNATPCIMLHIHPMVINDNRNWSTPNNKAVTLNCFPMQADTTVPAPDVKGMQLSTKQITAKGLSRRTIELLHDTKVLLAYVADYLAV